MKDIAILYQKIDLGYGKYGFRPIRILTGYYIDDENLFVTGRKEKYESITNFNKKTDGDLYFGATINIETLIENYIGELNYKNVNYEFNINDIIESAEYEYLSDCSDQYVLGINKDGDFRLMGLNLHDVCDTNNSINSKPQPNICLKDLRDTVLKEIVSQDDAVRKVTQTIYKNYNSKSAQNKSHILIAGPTGTGKTKMIQVICKTLGVPYYRVVATDYTSEGYQGKSIDNMIEGLIDVCDGNIELAQNGILIIDEIDKKAFKDNNDTIASKAVLDAILKITDRDSGDIEVTVGSGPRENIISFNPANLTVILMGAFEGILKTDNKINPGFNSVDVKQANKHTELTEADIIKYGLTPELLGRINCFVTTKAYEKDDLKNIILNSSSSQLNNSKEFFNEYGVEFEADDGYIDAIAEVAYKKHLGARSIKSAIIESLSIAEEEIMEANDPLNKEAKNKVKTLKVTRDTVLDPKKYYIS